MGSITDTLPRLPVTEVLPSLGAAALLESQMAIRAQVQQFRAMAEAQPDAARRGRFRDGGFLAMAELGNFLEIN